MSKRNTITDGANALNKALKDNIGKVKDSDTYTKIPVFTRDQHGVVRDEHGTIHVGQFADAIPAPVFFRDRDGLVRQRGSVDVSTPEGERTVKHHNVVRELYAKIDKVLQDHPGDRNSLHEAWGLIREEFLELEDELRKKNPRYKDIADEAYDVMITCARLIAFCQDRLPQEFMPDLKNKDGKYPGHEDHF